MITTGGLKFALPVLSFYRSAISDEWIDLWQRNKKFKSYHDLLKGEKINISQRSLIRLIFEITLDLILKDLILFNYAFMLPHMNGGYLKVYDETRWFSNKHLNRRYSSLVFRDFQRHYIWRYRFYIKLSRKYHSLLMSKVKKGHTYPQEDAK